MYLPVEVALRELYPKAFLAAFLAKKGYRVFVHPDYMLPKLGFHGGVVLGKNQIHAKKVLSKSRKKKSFVLFEEEGAPVSGDDNERNIVVQDRLREGAEEISDVITTWGRWQNEAIRGITDKSVVCTGSLYMELSKPKYKSACAELDLDITGGLSGYLLVNTRFVFANGEGAPYTAFTGNPTYTYKGATPGYWRKNFSNEMSMLGAFIKLVERIAVTFPELAIVLRPHPAENCLFYEEIFKDFDNITVTNAGHVISWIRNAACVLTNGCTTSMQSEVGGVPVINFKPDFCTNDPTLLDGIGFQANSEDEVIFAINNFIRKEYGIFKCGNWLDELETYSLECDSIEKFGYIVDELSINHVPDNFSAKNIFLRLLNVHLANFVKDLLKRPKAHKEFGSFRKYCSSAAKHFGITVVISEPVENYYIVQCDCDASLKKTRLPKRCV
ncbi:MAG: hypothetical protein K8H75_15220 [Sulfuricella sp.]|nr:hypothetical protein [Sulfuricella sp.]